MLGPSGAGGRPDNHGEVRVTTWPQLIEQLYDGSWNPDLQRFRSPYAFRGVAEAGFGLETSLSRLGGDFAEMEQHLAAHGIKAPAG